MRCKPRFCWIAGHYSPSFTLGGEGGGIAYNKAEFETIVANGLRLSPVSEVLIEESVLGWKEFEMEVVRDTRQLYHCMFHRKCRPDGCSYRRLNDGGPSADPD